jgi:hypothetical protein
MGYGILFGYPISTTITKNAYRDVTPSRVKSVKKSLLQFSSGTTLPVHLKKTIASTPLEILM